ncbi:hypothetical protein [Acidocella sp.]|jgi:hypothetical protein|uniref:hypothetical protein n=1 Tax=Acidocella sp. TaxID=50710 RepID=UPI002F40D314
MLNDFATGRVIGIRINYEDPAKQAAATRLIESVVDASNHIDQHRMEAAILKLAEVILPDDQGEVRGTLAMDNLKLRDRFVDETGPLTSLEVAKLSGSKGTNLYATATRWKSANRVFSVSHRGQEYYPSFQFKDGSPHPMIKKVLAALPASMSPWQKAFWFVSTNGWLGDRAPADMLDDAAAVVAAAEHEGKEVTG